MSSSPNSDYSIHSDFLIHWTGKDIDNVHEPEWHREHLSTRNKTVVDLYVKRLQAILQYGLWMTVENGDTFSVGGTPLAVPCVPKCCFTELRLSQSRVHARRYGRLGIGVKRAFLFDRFGRPLSYVGFTGERHKDKFLEACLRDLRDQRLLNFFKPMNSKLKPLNYDLYSESEWRILYFEELLAKRLIVDPRDSKNAAEHAYFNSLSVGQQTMLKYLIPLDGWFAMIIYPALDAKNLAQRDENAGIREQIQRIKRLQDHGNRVERGNWPIEVDLDACRHF